MTILICGLLLFLGIHSVQIMAPNFRGQMVARQGNANMWRLSYALIAVAGFVLIIYGYGLVRYETALLYQPPVHLRHLTLLVMLPVFPLLFATYIKGHIRNRLGHPMLIATILWAIAHLMANGSLADVVLFGSFLVWAALDWRSLLRREQAAPSGNRKNWLRNDIIAVAGGLVLYLLFVRLFHVMLFGVSPI